MARPTNRLTAREVATIKTPGRHADGGGLYLQVDPSLAKRWVLVFQWRGKRKEMGLGGVALITLASARDAALEARKLVARGINPIEARKAPGEVPTFGEVADDMLASVQKGWRNEKHRAQWKMSLVVLAAPLRPLPVDQVGTDDVLGVLKPIWTEKPETASRLRGRIERVLDAAKAKGLRTGENPARWRGHLALLLPKPSKLSRGHHAAMPFADVPEFFARLKDRPALAARALELVILTIARTNEMLGARWGEFDLDAALWIVPPDRMKMAIEHRVALCRLAVQILLQLREEAEIMGPVDGKDLVFPGQREGRPLSNMALTMLLRRMDADAYTVHGFRSSFRDWAGEATSYPREVAEAALAHKVGDETERAYRRGDALAKRRKLMEAWAGYLARPRGGSVVPMARPR